LLYTITLVVNFLSLVAAVWQGVYLVTRSPRSQVASLTGEIISQIAIHVQKARQQAQKARMSPTSLELKIENFERQLFE
jgi:hydroxymethylglutaryl-CoA reductase